jgi:hypothetical protein
MPGFLLLLGRYWYIPALAAAIFAILWLRNDNLAKSGDLKAANTQVADLTRANKAAQQALDKVTAIRIDNDAIAAAVAAKIGTNTTREVRTNTVIEKAAANDPQVRAVTDIPLPDSLRAALRAH